MNLGYNNLGVIKMTTIKTPKSPNPYRVTINNKKYSYPADTIVEVPDEVASLILNNNNNEPIDTKYVPITMEALDKRISAIEEGGASSGAGYVTNFSKDINKELTHDDISRATFSIAIKCIGYDKAYPALVETETGYAIPNTQKAEILSVTSLVGEEEQIFELNEIRDSVIEATASDTPNLVERYVADGNGFFIYEAEYDFSSAEEVEAMAEQLQAITLTKAVTRTFICEEIDAK